VFTVTSRLLDVGARGSFEASRQGRRSKSEEPLLSQFLISEQWRVSQQGTLDDRPRRKGEEIAGLRSFDKSVCEPGDIGPRLVIVQKVYEWRTHSFLSFLLRDVESPSSFSSLIPLRSDPHLYLLHVLVCDFFLRGLEQRRPMETVVLNMRQWAFLVTFRISSHGPSFGCCDRLNFQIPHRSFYFCFPNNAHLDTLRDIIDFPAARLSYYLSFQGY
jgi:hypothetical protein